MSKTLRQQVLDLFGSDLNLLVPSVDTDLIDQGLLDSLVFVDLIMKLETTFGVEVPVADLEIDQLRSVTRIAAFVTSLQDARRAVCESAA
jgi:acyl carrier protein